jgi:chromate transport protein ChrA
MTFQAFCCTASVEMYIVLDFLWSWVTSELQHSTHQTTVVYIGIAHLVWHSFLYLHYVIIIVVAIIVMMAHVRSQKPLST